MRTGRSGIDHTILQPSHQFRRETKGNMKIWYRILPWSFLALFAMEIIVLMLPKADGRLHTAEFGRLPVLLNGRIQPLDSVARNSLLQMRSTGDVPLEEVPSWKFWHHPQKLKSTEWLLVVFFNPSVADTRPIFLIHHPDLISELKLDNKGVEKSGLRYYSYNELVPVLSEIAGQGRRADETEDALRTTYQKQVMKLANALLLYQRLKSSIEPEGTHDFASVMTHYQASLPAAKAAFRAQQAGEKVDATTLQQFATVAKQFEDMANFAYPLVVPPVNPADKDAWMNVGASVLASIPDARIQPAVGYFA